MSAELDAQPPSATIFKIRMFDSPKTSTHHFATGERRQEEVQ